MPEDEKLNTEDLLKLAKKSFKNAFVGLGTDPEAQLKKLPTGITMFDQIIGGGLVRGRTHIFAGEFSSGKTYLGQKAIQAAQALGGTCVYVDAEKRYDPDWFKLTGVDIDNLIVLQPNYGEQAVDMVVTCLKSKADVVILDSIAVLTPIKSLDESAENQNFALLARMVNPALNKFIAANYSTVLILINQLRQNISTGYTANRGIQMKLPGGEGQNFNAACIVDIRKGESITQEGKKVGHNIRCHVTKCNFAPPFEVCNIPLIYSTGQVDLLGAIVNSAVDFGIIKKKSGWYLIEGLEKPVQGLGGVCEWFKEHSDEFEKLKSAVYNFEEAENKI